MPHPGQLRHLVARVYIDDQIITPISYCILTRLACFCPLRLAERECDRTTAFD
jgi:hypothetical protein